MGSDAPPTPPSWWGFLGLKSAALGFFALYLAKHALIYTLAPFHFFLLYASCTYDGSRCWISDWPP